MELKKRREIFLIFGRTGSGKSYLTKELIKSYSRVIIIDALGEYENGIIFENFRDLLDYYSENSPLEFTFICRFKSDREIEFLFQFCEIATNIMLVVEESEIYINPQSKSGNFLRLVRYGRHYDISIIAIARRIIELSNDIRAQCNYIYSFKQINPRDIAYLKQLGFSKVDSLDETKHEYELIQY